MPTPAALLSLPTRGWIAFQQRDPLTFDEPVGDLPIVDDARWSAAITGSSWGALVVWVILLILLQAAAWPLTRRVFTQLPDRGWAFSRLIALLIAGYLTWLLASLHLIRFQAIWAAVSLGIVAVVSVIVTRIRARKPASAPIYRNNLAVSAEVVFWGVFGLFLLYRAINPDSYHPYWGGEKPMEFAHLNSILRSAHFPPVDPWYSGGFINYYYYGTYLVAFMIKLTGIPVELAFNLAQPTFPALLASASFSLAAALGKRMTGSTFHAWLSGLFGMVLVQFSGNMVVASRLVSGAVDGMPSSNDWNWWVWTPSRALPTPDRGTNITEFPYFAALYADLHPHVIAMPFTVFVVALAWQMASAWRSVPLFEGRNVSRRLVVTSIAAPLLLAALALATIFMANAWDLPMYAIITSVGIIMMTAGIRAPVRRIAITGAMIGGVALLAYLLAIPFNRHYVALFGQIETVRDRTPLLGVEAHLGAQLLLATIAVAALMIPRSGIARSWQLVFGAGASLTLAFFLLMQLLATRSGASDTALAEAGVVLTVVLVWLASAWSAIDRDRPLPFGGTMLYRAFDLLLLGIAITTVVLVATDRHTLALYAGIGLAAGVMWLVLARPSERFVLMLVAGATLLGGSLEILYLVDDLSSTDWYRMNTIFKFYNQIWVLLGIATAVLTARAVWDILVHTDEAREPGKARALPPRLWTWLAAALSVPVMLATLAYAVMATPVRLDTRFPGGDSLTLDAYAWMNYGEIPLFRIDDNGQRQQIDPLRYEDDLAAIDWLNDNVHGTPVIAEAAFGTYRCNGSRFSINTGLPAVIGWQRHQQQQRYLDDLAIRENALRELYTNPDTDTQLEIIERYDVEYVIVGQTERHYPTIDGNECIDTGSPEAIASLEALEGDQLEVAFSSGSTTIYRIIGD